MARHSSDELRADPADRASPRAERQRRPTRERREKPQRRKRGRTLLRWSVLASLWGLIAGVVMLGYFALTLPDTADLTLAARRPSITLLASSKAVARLGLQTACITVPVGSVPKICRCASSHRQTG